MEPNAFSIDPERLLNVLFAIVVLSFLVERALAILFENRWYVQRLGGKGLKEPIALLVGFAVCKQWNFDAMTSLLGGGSTKFWGYFITAAIIAGGSKASLKLFHDVLDVRSDAEKQRQAIVDAKAKVNEEAARVSTLRAALRPPGAPPEALKLDAPAE